MLNLKLFGASACIVPALVVLSGCTVSGSGNKVSVPRTVTVARSGPADVVGSDNAALQKAADMLRPGDTLSIGPGSWSMDNKLEIPCSNVTVRGAANGQTVLLKTPGVSSRVLDGSNYGGRVVIVGERLLVVAEPEKFHPGMGVTVKDDVHNGCWDLTITTVREVAGDTLRIEPVTIRDYDYESCNPKVENKYPILTAYGQEGLTIEDIVVDGNMAGGTANLDGCQGGGIYLRNTRNSTLRNCEVRNYNGDGISFQTTDHIKVLDCESHHNAGFGIHPGTGSPDAEIRHCHFHHNGQIGLYLCWCVSHGIFSDNLIEANGQYGISIGYKDTDNLFENNTIRGNGICGVYYRNENERFAGHRNVFRNNTIADNGGAGQGYGVYVEPYAHDLVFEGNTIQETRPVAEATQQWGIYVMRGAGPVKSEHNTFKGNLRGELKDEN